MYANNILSGRVNGKWKEFWGGEKKMADYIEPKKRRKRIKINEFQGETNCPPGYHWVRGHLAKSRFGFRTHWVKAHCAKDGGPPEMEVIHQITRNKGKTPIFDRENEIVEKPMTDELPDGKSGIK